MAITTTIIDRSVFGDKKIVTGKSVFSGTAKTGDVVTGLSRIEAFFMTTVGTTAKAVSHNETLPLASGDITAYTEDDDATFTWIAIGK